MKSKQDSNSHEPKIQARKFKPRPEDFSADRTQVVGADLDFLLNSDRSLAIEIGCGVGLHPIQYAAEFPSNNMIAIERTAEKFMRFKGRLERHPNLQKNLCGVHADAIHFLDQNIQDKTVDEVWILYPNPEVKKTSKRWFQTPFMSRLTELLKPGAQLYFATNLEDYARDAVNLAPRHQLRLTSETRINRISHPGWKARTHFEKKYHERGETLFDLIFQFEPIGVSQ